ncbi:MAG: hypothetical protein ABI416_19830 [Ginsengibacter sp.]
MKNPSISVTILANSAQNIRLLVQGQLIMKNAPLVKKELINALNSSENIALVLKNIVKADLGVLQLLIGLQKSAALLGKTLTLDIELTHNIHSVILSSGLEKILIPNSKLQLNGIY